MKGAGVRGCAGARVPVLGALVLSGVALIVLGGGEAVAQVQMPDPSLIHGRAIPASELSTGTVTVRVVRESIGNNIAGQEVRVLVDGATRTAKTDDLGRAEFPGLPQGKTGSAEATVDGERLVSEPFMVPTSGGLRVILVAGMAAAAERRTKEEAAAAAAPATKGVVVLGRDSRVLMQFNDDSLQVFYVLNVINNARTRVDIGGPILIDLPTGAASASLLEGSSPSASVSGSRLTITGPFAAGTTAVQVAYRLRYDAANLVFSQTWPVALQQVIVAVEKVGDIGMSSPQLSTTNEVSAENGEVFLLGNGPALEAGATLTLTLSNLPFHSRTPRYVALTLAGLAIALGVWLSVAAYSKRNESQQQLVRRRDSLLNELAQLEAKRRAGTVNVDRYTARHHRLMGELEHIYGELDEVGRPQGGGEGVAA
jgi:hypothetical protein